VKETKNKFSSPGGAVILIDKPQGWTSFDVVKKVRNIVTPHRVSLKEEEEQSVRFKVGHAGTLDPLATGLLIICTEKMTRKISEFQEMEKEYTGTFVLGATTPSYDLETTVIPGKDYSHLTKKMIHDAVKHFTGKIMQAAPLHSAKKIEGVRAYEIARKGKQAELKPVEVHVHSFEITAIHLPEVSFKVVCSKGTYIRSLANDFGKQLGCGAYLGSLCRTRIGGYALEDALSPEEFEKEFLAAAGLLIEK
jgi:tRNA pseudouridine55 synthase